MSTNDLTMKKYAFWNNKGGVGKTFLCFMVASEYARLHPETKVVIIDMCPQANVSEIVLGGNGKGSRNLTALLSKEDRKSIGGYFDKRLSRPDEKLGIEGGYLIEAQDYGEKLPDNLLLVAGDPSLELQVQSINQLASVTLPKDRWKNVHSWLIDLQQGIASKYDNNVVFFTDCNPSFASYTAQALLASNRLIIPCTADGSSARAFDNIAQLLYGFDVPKQYETSNFNARVSEYNMEIPLIHLVLFNRYTMSREKPAKAFTAMYDAIKERAKSLYERQPNKFTYPVERTFYNIPDAHTVAIVSSQNALPLHSVESGQHTLEHGKIAIQPESLDRYRNELDSLIRSI